VGVAHGPGAEANNVIQNVGEFNGRYNIELELLYKVSFPMKRWMSYTRLPLICLTSIIVNIIFRPTVKLAHCSFYLLTYQLVLYGRTRITVCYLYQLTSNSVWVTVGCRFQISIACLLLLTILLHCIIPTSISNLKDCFVIRSLAFISYYLVLSHIILYSSSFRLRQWRPINILLTFSITIATYLVSYSITYSYYLLTYSFEDDEYKSG